MKAEFQNTVSILVKAFLEGTLLKGDCRACAVGNICAAATNRVITILDKDGRYDQRRGLWYNKNGMAVYPQWGCLFTSANGEQELYYKKPKHDPQYFAEAYADIEATGYSVEELARVEFAFESAQLGYNEEAEFAGLMAVVDVLADIHGIDLATATAAKELFVKA
jgi:hypothetical protein